ncbi:hypothetical protein RB623_09920 [Mesorhizobium sp. LHD-90]|uniref:hypothetical protein n=1 Tax=Mesorhizobium sp. LHD-90 TaxID=3071414 RepID=UPI0027E148EF|nr:hypothetical protein [Mesorhizobium sp. LHD-90]MDQ6434365.1 hypothetical protein [Mesorhizobium sp. LHD-90]
MKIHRKPDAYYVEPFDLTENERGWIEFIRLASRDTDPKPTLDRVQQLQKMFRNEG